MSGPFISQDYQPQISSLDDIKVASIFWGWQLGFTVLVGADAGGLTFKVWRRTGGLTPYVVMVWIEILCNMIWGVICWMFLNEYIAPSFWFFLTIVILWCFQLHCLIQIIVNRCSLLIQSRRTKFLLKWGCCAVVLFINISVFCIWVPAQLQISDTFTRINHIWDRIEKGIFLILDASLNCYFLYLVKTKLMDSGMTKYWPLFKFNCGIIFISLSLDVAIIALMSLPNGLLYAQFHPVAYMIKLSIEMTMAKLIGKIARSQEGSGPSYSGERSTAGYVSDGKGGHMKVRGRRGRTKYGVGSGAEETDAEARERREKNRFESTVVASRIGDDDDDVGNGGGLYHAWVSGPQRGGRRRSADVLKEHQGEAVEMEEGVAGVITKDTTVTVRAESIAGPGALDSGDAIERADRASETSSTRELRPVRRPADAF